MYIRLNAAEISPHTKNATRDGIPINLLAMRGILAAVPVGVRVVGEIRRYHSLTSIACPRLHLQELVLGELHEEPAMRRKTFSNRNDPEDGPGRF